jgi:hypothetical protein
VFLFPSDIYKAAKRGNANSDSAAKRKKFFCYEVASGKRDFWIWPASVT